MANLLAVQPMVIVYIALGVVGLFLLLYGFLRRFSKMSWWGYEVFALFGLTYILKLISPNAPKMLAFWLVVAAFLVATGIIVGIGALVRKGFRSREEQGKGNWLTRLLDGLLGIITAVVNFVAIVLVVVGPLALVLSYTPVLPNVFAALKGFTLEGFHPWDFVRFHAIDFLMISVFIGVIKGGYKMGLLRSVWTILMIVLGLGAVVGAVLLSIKMPGVCELSKTLSNLFLAKMPPLFANIIGYGIVAVGIFIIFVIVLVLVNMLVDLGLRGVDSVGVLRFLDGLVVCIIFFVVAVAVVNLFDWAVMVAATGKWSGIVQDVVTNKFPFAEVIQLSPLSKFFYEFNFFLNILPIG